MNLCSYFSCYDNLCSTLLIASIVGRVLFPISSRTVCVNYTWKLQTRDIVKESRLELDLQSKANLSLQSVSNHIASCTFVVFVILSKLSLKLNNFKIEIVIHLEFRKLVSTLSLCTSVGKLHSCLVITSSKYTFIVGEVEKTLEITLANRVFYHIKLWSEHVTNYILV